MATTPYFGIPYYAALDTAGEGLWGGTDDNLHLTWEKAIAFAQLTGEFPVEEREYRLITKTRWPLDIQSLTLETDAGTLTAAVKIDGVAVTGLSAVSASTTETTTSASALRSVPEGANVTLAISGITGAAWLRYNLYANRTGTGTA